MNKRNILFIAVAVVILLAGVVTWLKVPVQVEFTLYMYNDKPQIAEKIAKAIEGAETEKFIHESVEYVYTWPEVEPWREYVYVIKGTGSRIQVHYLNGKYRKSCYNMAVKYNPSFSSEQQALLWSEIE